MPTIRGKKGKGPAKQAARAAGRVSSGKAFPADPTASSPGSLLPGGGVLRWHGWRVPVMRSVGKISTGCSGTVIAANLVLTAAHCLYTIADPNGTRVCREESGPVQFFPGGSATNPPKAGTINDTYGTWTSRRWWVPTAFKCPVHGGSANSHYDWAIIEMQTNRGKTIASVAGSYEAWWNLNVPANGRLYIIGYPASGQWKKADYLYGMSQYVCDVSFDGNYEDLDGAAGNAWAYVVPCPMNGGVSGGPWFVYHGGQKKWVIAGVSGWCRVKPCTPRATVLMSRHLDDDFRVFWEAVKRQL